RNIDAAESGRRRILRQRQPGADTDIENAAADPVGLGDGRLPAGVEHLAEHEIVDRRPAPVSLFDPLAVDIACHAPAPRPAYPRSASTSGRDVAPWAAAL